MDLTNMTAAELHTLRQEIDAKIIARKDEDLAKAVATFREVGATFGLSNEDLANLLVGKKVAGGKGAATKGAAQFANPADKSLTWTGRGRKPQWVADHLAAGGQLDDLRI